jgi:hypothetical protein
MMDYSGSGVAAGFLGGRPLPGESLIASKTSGEYIASCDMGFKPLRKMRLITVSRGRLSFSAISEIVIPSMFLYRQSNFLKKCQQKRTNMLDEMSVYKYI